MSEAVIIATARTPIGRARKGTLAGMDAFQLAEVVLAASLERSGVPAADIDDLILAESYQGGGVIARNVAVRQGLTGVPGSPTTGTARRAWPRCRRRPPASGPGWTRWC